MLFICLSICSFVYIFIFSSYIFNVLVLLSSLLLEVDRFIGFAD